VNFGLELAHPEINREQGVREAMVRAPGDTGSGTAVQLLAPLRPDSPDLARFIDRSGPGHTTAGLPGDRRGQATAVLRAKGMRVLYPEARAWHGQPVG